MKKTEKPRNKCIAELVRGNNSEIKKLIERLKRYAIKRGYPQLADDFSQEAFIALFRGRKAKFEQLFIDFLRSEYGGSRSAGGAARSRATLGIVELNTHDFGELPTAIGHYWGPGGCDGQTDPTAPSSIGKNWREFVSLNPRDSEICFMRYDLEMSEREIAEEFGVSESRVCQILGGRISKAIERASVLSEMKESYKEPEASILEIKWITI